MKARISVTEFSRELRSILDRVHQRGDSFVIEQNGEALAALEPVASLATWATLAAAMRSAPRPGSAFAVDLEEIQRNQPEIVTDMWLS